MQVPKGLINQGEVLNPSLMDAGLEMVTVASHGGTAEVRKAQLERLPAPLPWVP